jgi:hypothetical protein
LKLDPNVEDATSRLDPMLLFSAFGLAGTMLDPKRNSHPPPGFYRPSGLRIVVPERRTSCHTFFPKEVETIEVNQVFTWYDVPTLDEKAKWETQTKYISLYNSIQSWNL